MTTSLVLHKGAVEVGRDHLDQVEAPPPTATWYPVKHSTFLDTVLGTLEGSGFQVVKQRLALARDDQRFFGTLDLSTELAEGVSLAVGIRNSTDKSFPMGWCCGSRVFVCDNLAFRSEHVIARKHTRFGQMRFTNALSQAVTELHEFRSLEAERIKVLQNHPLTPHEADSYLLRAYEQEIVSSKVLPRVIQEWRTPSFEEFAPRTSWSLLNAFTTVIAERQRTNPAEFATQTIRLQQLLSSN